MAKVSGGQLVAKALRREGIETIFTLCGGHVMDIYNGCLEEGIRIIDVRHEQTAAHAADAWTRLTGFPGVAVVTAGPGVTDAITGVAQCLPSPGADAESSGGRPRSETCTRADCRR